MESLDLRQFFEKMYDNATERLKVLATVDSITLSSTTDSISVFPKGTANEITTGSVAFGAVGAGYGTILDLAAVEHAHCKIVNTLNTACTIRFGGSGEMVLAGGENYVFDMFKHSGKIEVKHNGAAPGSGIISAWSY